MVLSAWMRIVLLKQSSEHFVREREREDLQMGGWGDKVPPPVGSFLQIMCTPALIIKGKDISELLNHTSDSSALHLIIVFISSVLFVFL